jgi:hypothetical protein
MHQGGFEGSTRQPSNDRGAKGVSRRKARGSRAPRAIEAARWTVTLGLSLLSACSFGPYDGTQVDTRSTPVLFNGFGSTGGQPIAFQVLSGAGGPSVIGSTTLSTEPTPYNGANYYQWSKSIVIPQNRWTPGPAGGYYATVRSRIDSNGTFLYPYTFPPNWSTCYDGLADKGEFVFECRSPHSPLAYVYTADFPHGADFAVTRLSMPAAGGNITITVKNLGRDTGTVTGFSCYQDATGLGNFGSASLVLHDHEEGTLVSHAGWFRFVTECAVGGVTAGGAAETNLGNNRLEVLPDGL